MDVLKFFLGAFFALGGLTISLFHSHDGRTPGFVFLLIVLSVGQALLAGGFLAGARHRGAQQNRLFSGFTEFKELWSFGSYNPEITNAGAFILVSIGINLFIANFIGL